MYLSRLFTLIAAMFALVPAQAAAQEIYGGIHAHAVDTPVTLETNEGGVDLQAGVRFAEIDALGGAQPYVIGSVNLSGDTSFVGAGLSWKVDLGGFYIRPGMGIVVHDAPERRVDPETNLRTDLGARVLFEPEFGIGVELDDRWSVEASWVHISNARLFDGGQNPGIDMIGLRVNFRM